MRRIFSLLFFSGLFFSQIQAQIPWVSEQQLIADGYAGSDFISKADVVCQLKSTTAVTEEHGRIDTVNAEGVAYSDHKRFKGFDYVKGANRLPYRLFVPDGSRPAKRYPLLLYIHGMGSIGTDNKKPLELSARFGCHDFQEKHPCIVLVPQCPVNKRWIVIENWDPPYKFSEEPAVPMGLLIKLLKRIMEDYPVDPTRIYVGGPSMGGFATWDIVCRLPDKFAAAFPICGGADVATAPALSQLPIWCSHGAKDNAVTVQFSRDMIAALKAAGGKPKYTEYSEAGHNVWDITLGNAQLFDWLFAQAKTSNNRGK